MLTLSKRLQVQVERVLLLRLDLVILPMLHSGAFANAPDKLLSSLVSALFAVLLLAITVIVLLLIVFFLFGVLSIFGF